MSAAEAGRRSSAEPGRVPAGRATQSAALGLGLGIAFVLCGCGEDPTPPATPPSAPEAASVPQPQPRSQPEAESEVQEPPGPPPELPARFPEDVAVYPGASLAEVKAPEGGEIYARFESGDHPDQIEAFYLKTLKSQGWNTRNPKPFNADERAVFGDKDVRTVTVIVYGSEKGQRIDLYLLDLEP